MKFKYKGRPKPITLVLQEGDVLTVSNYRTERILESHPNFDKSERKRHGSDKSGDSKQSA